MSESIRERLTFRAYESVQRIANAVPRRVGLALFRVAARIAHRALPERRAIVANNQSRVLGRPVTDPLVDAATREAFVLYAEYWLETFRSPALSDEEVQRRFRVDGIEHIDRALELGAGGLVVLPHMGNWDVAGRWLNSLGYKVASVAEVVRPPRLFEMFVRHRESLGMTIVPLAPGGVGQRLATMLADNATVALVADRDLNGRGVEVEMFGGTRRLPAGPALLSITSGAPILVTGITTTADGWRCVIEPPIDAKLSGDRRTDVRLLTQRIAEGFERRISARPPDWHLFQPGWTP